jgi:hypothetical protein
MRITSIEIEKLIRSGLAGSPMQFTCRFICDSPLEGAESSCLIDGRDMSQEQAAEMLRVFALAIERWKPEAG